MIITPEKDGQLVLNDGELTETWMDGWNYLEFVREVNAEVKEAIVQRHTITITS